MSLTEVREARGRISLLPRALHHAYALALGYFWLPCPLCGREMGGHEWREVEGKTASVPTERPGTSHGICPICTYQGLGAGPVRPDEEPMP